MSEPAKQLQLRKSFCLSKNVGKNCYRAGFKGGRRIEVPSPNERLQMVAFD